MKGCRMCCFPPKCSQPEGCECARVLGRRHKGKERRDERREKGRKKRERRGRFEWKEQVDKRFPLDSDWQHLNAHTVGCCLHSLKAQYSAIYFETAFVVDLQGMLAACYLPKRTKKYSSEACSTVPTSFLCVSAND